MDLKKKKAIHLRCPKCGYDFAYNTNHIENQIDSLKSQTAELKSMIAQYNEQHPNKNERNRSPWYRRTCALMHEKDSQLAELKKARKAIVVEIKLQEFEIFKKVVKEHVGKEMFLKMIGETEDIMVYDEYDMAKQKYTRFEGA